MSAIVHLDSNMVPAQLRAGYSGKMFKARVCESMTIPNTAGLWDSGSRDTFRVVRMADGAVIEPLRSQAPWDASRRSDQPVTLEPGICVIEHSIFLGKDLGLTFYVHPADAVAMLPAPVRLTELEAIILAATIGMKSSYGGKDRYQMQCENMRYSGKPCPTRAQWDECKVALAGRGYLNKAGAITTAGRNAIQR